MYKHGYRSNVSYLIGVWYDKEAALLAAKKEEEYRSGNYEAEVVRANIQTNTSIVIKPLMKANAYSGLDMRASSF